jgi:hypothetical protein
MFWQWQTTVTLRATPNGARLSQTLSGFLVLRGSTSLKPSYFKIAIQNLREAEGLKDQGTLFEANSKKWVLRNLHRRHARRGLAFVIAKRYHVGDPVKGFLLWNVSLFSPQWRFILSLGQRQDWDTFFFCGVTMKTIQLTKGRVAFVDDEDYAELSKYKWHASSVSRSGGVYAVRSVGDRKFRRTISILPMTLTTKTLTP